MTFADDGAGEDLLDLGRYTTLTWSRGGQESGSSSLIAKQGGVRLNYRVTDHNGECVSVDELLPFVYSPTRFGGRRQWLSCLKCGRACRKIYGRGQ